MFIIIAYRFIAEIMADVRAMRASMSKNNVFMAD